MAATFPITKQNGYACSPIPKVSGEASTFHTSRVRLDKVSAIAESLEEEDLIRAYHALMPERTMEEEEAKEQEWEEIVSKPHVRNALRRMAREARRQYSAGETQEGGFGLE